MNGAVAAGVDKLCHAFVANDLENYINSIGRNYSYELCFSYGDEVISSANVMQGGPAFTENAFEVTGNHDEAGSQCIRRFVGFFVSQIPPNILFPFTLRSFLPIYSKLRIELGKLCKLCSTTHRWLLWKKRSCIVVEPTKLRSFVITLI